MTRERLREDFSLEVFDSLGELNGRCPGRRVVRNQDDAELLGVRRGQLAAHPPANGSPVQVNTGRTERHGRLHWAMSAEGPYWQGNLLLEAEARPQGEPLYAFFDRLGEIFPQLERAVQLEEHWPQGHEPMMRTVEAVLSRAELEEPKLPELARANRWYRFIATSAADHIVEAEGWDMVVNADASLMAWNPARDKPDGRTLPFNPAALRERVSEALGEIAGQSGWKRSRAIRARTGSAFRGKSWLARASYAVEITLP